MNATEAIKSAPRHRRPYRKHVSVPADSGVRVDRAITIQQPVEEVYAFWRQLENLPRFLRHVVAVIVKDKIHSRWTVNPGSGQNFEWDAEIIEELPNEVLSWRSMPDAEVDNAGSVRFQRATGDRGTVVKVSLIYRPPAGKVGVMIAKLLGWDAKAEVEEDLLRVRSLLETGEIPTIKGQPNGNGKGDRK